MQRKISLTQVICLRIEKTIETKPYRVNLRSLLPRIHYYQSQAVTSKRNFSTQYQPTIEPLPQYPIGFILQWQSLHSMYESQYMTNQ